MSIIAFALVAAWIMLFASTWCVMRFGTKSQMRFLTWTRLAQTAGVVYALVGTFGESEHWARMVYAMISAPGLAILLYEVGDRLYVLYIEPKLRPIPANGVYVDGDGPFLQPARAPNHFSEGLNDSLRDGTQRRGQLIGCSSIHL